MQKRKECEIYNLIHERIKADASPKDFIFRKEFFTVLGRVYHVPKSSRHCVMNEMISCKLLRKVKNDCLIIL